MCVCIHARARYSWFDVYFISRHFEFYEMRRSTAFFNNLLDIRYGYSTIIEQRRSSYFRSKVSLLLKIHIFETMFYTRDIFFPEGYVISIFNLSLRLLSRDSQIFSFLTKVQICFLHSFERMFFCKFLMYNLNARDNGTVM